jgi:hypothetical protein
MPTYCFECGVEVPEEKKVVRGDRVFCSTAHARTKRKQPAPAQVKRAAPVTPTQTAAAQVPASQPATAEKASVTPAAAPPKPPQA